MGSIEIEAIATRVRTYQGGIGLERAALKKKINHIHFLFIRYQLYPFIS